MKKSFAALLLVSVAANASGAMGTSTLTSSTRELNGGTIYVVSNDVTINAGTTESALKVVDKGSGEGKIVVIDINEGKTLTVVGGNADGRTGAGAGIELPAGMSLYITGKGALKAAGGNAENGGNGSSGGSASIDDSQHKNGAGGSGGYGGGGAAAGIGGTGGRGSNGGSGGARGDGKASSGRTFAEDGKSGSQGQDGSDGSACGNVYILGEVSVLVYGGRAGAAGNQSWSYGKYSIEDAGDDWFAGGGGPGGAGGGGGAAYAIGGGGGGGGAGGGGGSGSYVKIDDWDDPGNNNLFVYDADGVRIVDENTIRGGAGGNGGGGSMDGGGARTDGEAGKTKENYESDHGNSTAGSGANGTDGYKQGAGGLIYALPTAGVLGSPAATAEDDDTFPMGNFHSVTITLDLGLTTANGSKAMTTFKQPFANNMKLIGDAPDANGINPRVKRPGYRFAGFWTDDGLCIYGPDYKPTTRISRFTQDFKLTARWEIDPSILSVTSSGDAESALGIYGNEAITLRDAVNALVANPALAGADGRRRITFEKLAAGDRIVRLSSAIEIPANTRSFEIDGLCTLESGETGVAILANPEGPVFDFKGGASDAGGVFAISSLTFEGTGASGDGGVVRIAGGASVYIESSAFIGNGKSAAYNGGAISVSGSGSSLLGYALTFYGNKVQKRGGAVYVNGGYAMFANTTFSGNGAGSYGGAVVEDGNAEIDLLNCTFAGNKAATGTSIASRGGSAKIHAVNCIFAGSGAVSMNGGELAAEWCSMDADPSKVLSGFGAPVAQIVAGVRHVIHPPMGGATGNEDAAEVFCDSGYENILAVGRDGTKVTLAGSESLATVPFVLDQLAQVRTAPVRGAVRLATGTEPVTVELDGVLYDADGNAKSGETIETDVTVKYDSGETATTNLVIKTAGEGIFGLSVPVSGSDGLALNVTGVKVDALGPDTIAVATAPYALTAASVDVIASNDYLPLEGDSITIGNVAARSISAAKSFNARSAGSFTAGSLKGVKTIDMERVDISGGTLDWLGGNGPAKGVSFANLAEVTIGGGVPTDVNNATLTSGKEWEAASDGFFQLQAQCSNPTSCNVALDLCNASGAKILGITPSGTLGKKTDRRRLIWTVPVRNGQKVKLTVTSGELTSVKAQFIYFGVAE